MFTHNSVAIMSILSRRYYRINNNIAAFGIVNEYKHAAFGMVNKYKHAAFGMVNKNEIGIEETVYNCSIHDTCFKIRSIMVTVS